MQTIHCENCIALFTDYLDGNLTEELREAVRAHLNGCKDCSDHYDAFVKVSALMAEIPSMETPKALSLDIKSIMKTGEKRKAKKRARQWMSVAAVFVVCAGSLLAFNGETEDSIKDKSLMTAGVEDPSVMDADVNETQEEETLRSQDVVRAEGIADDELQYQYGLGEKRFELFDMAMEDANFAAEVEDMDLGYGYEVLDYFQEEDGSTTFVLYFYEDETHTVKTLENSADYLLLSNVRSFNWLKSEL